MNAKAYWIIGIVLTALTLGVSVGLFPILPERLPTHWNIKGEVDAYGDRTWSAFLLPICMAGTLGFFLVLPYLSPRSFSVDTFRETSLLIMLIILVMFAYIHGLTLYSGLRGQVDVARALVAGIFLGLAAMGNVLGKVRRNFYIGIKTPWTLASERVWNDTHRLGAWTFAVGGLLGFALALMGWLILATVVIVPAALIPVVYSFLHYKALERRGEV